VSGDLWKVEAWRLGKKDELTVFMDVMVNPNDQRRIHAAIERDVRAKVAAEIEADRVAVLAAVGDGHDYDCGVSFGKSVAVRIARGDS